MAKSEWSTEPIDQFEVLLELGKTLTSDKAVKELNKRFPKNKKTKNACDKKMRAEKGVSLYEYCAKPVNIKKEVELDRQIAEFKTEIDVWKRKYNTILKARSFEDRLLDEFSTKLAKIEAVKVPPYKKPKAHMSEETLVLLIGDIEIGDIISKEETHGYGEYNFDIFRLYLQQYLDTIANITANKLSGYRFNEAQVIFLGDIVIGLIHDELVETAEFPVVDQVLYGEEVFSQFLTELAQLFPKVEVDCVFGNHGRLQKKKQYKHRYNNFDYLLYHGIKNRCSLQKNLNFNIHRSFFFTKEIKGHNCLVLHGDDIKSWAGIPYYGIDRRVKQLTELVASRGEFIDYVFLGHFHQSSLLEKVKGKKIINGTFRPGDEYAIGSLGASGEPAQWMFGMHEKRGLTFLFEILLDHAFIDNPNREIRYKINGE